MSLQDTNPQRGCFEDGFVCFDEVVMVGTISLILISLIELRTPLANSPHYATTIASLEYFLAHFRLLSNPCIHTTENRSKLRKSFHFVTF